MWLIWINTLLPGPRKLVMEAGSVLNDMRSDRTWTIMMHRLFRPLLAILVAIALVGAPLAVLRPCHVTVHA